MMLSWRGLNGQIVEISFTGIRFPDDPRMSQELPSGEIWSGQEVSPISIC